MPSSNTDDESNDHLKRAEESGSGSTSATKDEEVGLEDAGRHQVTPEHQKGKKDRISTAVFTDWWTWEILSWIFSLAVVMIIVILLILYDGRPQSAWKGAVTINTTVALLTTVAKLGLVSANSSALGQLRWNWYTEPRPLSDLSGFDDASRGSLFGSLQLIAKLHVRHLASVGALFSVAAVFFSSLTQQSLTFPIGIVSSDNARMPSSYSYVTGTSSRFSINTTGLDFVSATDSKMLAAVAFSAYNGSGTVKESFALNPTCSTGNCTYEIFSSLAACSECVDRTAEIATTCVNGTDCSYSLALPDALGQPSLMTGNTLDDVAGLPVYTTLNISATTLNNQPFTVLNVSSLSTNYSSAEDGSGGYTPTTSYATECGVFMCLKTFNSSITNGTLNETIIAIHRINASSFTLTDAVYHANLSSSAIPSDPMPSTTNNSTTISISQASLNVFGKSLALLYTGAAILGPGIALENGTFTYGLGYSSTALQGLYADGAVNIHQAMADVATVMTNVIRQQSDPSNFAAGTAHSYEAFFVVRWGWIAYPAALEALVLTFLCVTIFKTSRSGVQGTWKASPLALLFHGLENRGRALENVSEVYKLSEINELAGKIRVQLARRGPGTTLVDAGTKDMKL